MDPESEFDVNQLRDHAMPLFICNVSKGENEVTPTVVLALAV